MPESPQRDRSAPARSPGLMVAVLVVVAAFVVLFDWVAGCLGLGAEPPDEGSPSAESAAGNSPR